MKLVYLPFQSTIKTMLGASAPTVSFVDEGDVVSPSSSSTYVAEIGFVQISSRNLLVGQKPDTQYNFDVSVNLYGKRGDVDGINAQARLILGTFFDGQNISVTDSGMVFNAIQTQRGIDPSLIQKGRFIIPLSFSFLSFQKES